MSVTAAGPSTPGTPSLSSALTAPPPRESLPPIPSAASPGTGSGSGSGSDPVQTSSTAKSREDSPQPLAAVPLPKPPLAFLQSAAPRLPLVAGIPIHQHRAKLEECAALHDQLQEMATELCAKQAWVTGLREECERYTAEIMRLRDVLHTTTSELQVNQRRVDELERENKTLRIELRAQGNAPSASDSTNPVRLQFYRRDPSPPCRLVSRSSGAEIRPAARASFIGWRPGVRQSHAADISPFNTQQTLKTQDMSDLPLHADVQNVSGAMSVYVCECFNAGVSPHIELLHSLHTGGCLVAVNPPVTFAQLSAMERVLCRQLNDSATKSVNGSMKRSLPPHRLGQNVSPSPSSLNGGAGTAPWVANVKMVSFRCDNWATDAMPILSMLRVLPEVQRVELAALGNTAVMRQFAEVLLMLPSVEDISLPELALSDDGLAELGALLTGRGRIPCAKEAEMYDPWSLAGATIHSSKDDNRHTADEMEGARVRPVSSTLESADHTQMERPEPIALRCVDLSRCVVANPMDFGSSLCGASVEVLILTGCRALRDAQVRDIIAGCPRLHTLDVSGCVNLTTACVASLNKHKTLRILRLENCPRIQRIELDRVVVLFSSLAHVTTLRAPELQRLPVPLTHTHVLFDFYAPQLVEITLKGILIDRGTLRALICAESKASDATQVCVGSLPPSPNLMSMASSVDHGSVQNPPRESPHTQETESQYTDKDQSQRHEDFLATPFEESSTPQPASASTTSKLLSAGFVDCVVACAEELEAFVQHQSQLLRLSLHGTKGVTDRIIVHLPETLIELDLGGVAQLAGSCVDALVTRTPRLVRLSLKNAGPRVTSPSVRRLHALVHLELLNLLGMPQLQSEVVSAIAIALPTLRVLYHETATVNGNASPVGAGPVLCVKRCDEEDEMRVDVQDCARELLQLRDETALALWMEARLPRAESLLPETPGGVKGVVDLGAPQPPLTAHTTYYEAAARTLSPKGRNGTMREATGAEGTCTDMCEESGGDKSASPNGHTRRGDAGEMEYNELDMDDEDEEEEDRTMQEARRAEAERKENTMGQRGRLAVERAPLGPWGAADIVAEHRKQLSVEEAPK